MKNDKNTLSNWITGFTDGEGCFHVGIFNNKKMFTGKQIQLEFTIIQHKRDVKILHKIKQFFKCGTVKSNHADRYCFKVKNFKHINEIIIPFFEKYRLLTIKGIMFRKFAYVANLIKKQEHITLKGVEKIEKIQLSMNNKYKSNKV
jgi:hypothetical protein